MKCFVLAALLLGPLALLAQPAANAPPPYDSTPRLGTIVPKLPADYALLLGTIKDPHHRQDAAFDFETGNIAGVAIVLIVQPAPGEVLRALGATVMMHDFNLAASLYRVPFLEVSVISNSIFAFPDAGHGTPVTPSGEINSHVLGQRLSSRILLDLIGRYGHELLHGTFGNPTSSPYPSANFETPREPHGLLAHCR